ncbi:MAG: MerR family DNA-binding protein [Burkholderiales bacterium]|nr:MerR family DNA-binding protein [Burkholderiales bacterium]
MSCHRGLVPRDEDISRLQFIQRAQRMNFTLAEIADLN